MRHKWRIVAIAVALLLASLAYSETQLRAVLENYAPFVALDTIQSTKPALKPLIVPLDLIDGKDVVAEVSWSVGNKSYQYLKLREGDELLLDFWATEALWTKPTIWLGKEPGNFGARRLITYQPYVFPSDTPLGNVESGFLEWEFDGKEYRSRRLPVFFLSLWVRNPIPLQN